MSEQSGYGYGIFDSNFAFYQSVSEHTEPETLRDISKRMKNLRVQIAANVSCPLDLLIEFLSDDDLELRRIAAFNPSCPFEVRILALAELAIEEDERSKRTEIVGSSIFTL